MDSSNKKTGKTSMTITKKGTQKPKSKNNAISLQQTYDADAELALALSTSDATDAAAASTYLNDDKFEQQQHLLHLKQQEEADAEYARQLADEFAADTTHANNQASASAIGEEPGDDMDAVLEEIARLEAQERLKATGHAYNGKPNINRILADEDEEEARISEKVKREAELREWRKERERQDADFAAAAEYDRLLVLSKKAIGTSDASISIHSTESNPTEETTLDSHEELEHELESESEPIPLTKDELRRARLAFFTTPNLPKF